MTRPKRGNGYLDMAAKRGSTERKYNGRIGDVAGELAKSGARRDPCRKVVSVAQPKLPLREYGVMTWVRLYVPPWENASD